MRRLSFVLAVVLLSAVPASADDAAPLNATLALRGDSVAASLDVSDAMTNDFRRRLRNGVKCKAQIGVKLADGRTTLASVQRSCVLQLEVWDELVDVQVTDGGRPAVLTRRKLFDRALRDCAVAEDLVLASRDLLDAGGRYRLEVLVQLNPVSAEQRRRVREFMTDPRYGHRTRSRTFFGAVAAFFGVTQELSDDSFLFRSSWLNSPRSRR